MRTYWTARGLAESGHEVHVVTNAKEAGPPFRMHMRAEDWIRCEARLGVGSVKVHWTDPVDRSQSYIPIASPFVSKLAAIAARVHSEHPFDVIYSHYMEPYGVAGYLASQITGVPHVVRMAGSDAGRLWQHPQLEALYDHVLRSADVLIAAGAVAHRAMQRGVDSNRIAFGGGYGLPENIFTSDGPTLDLKMLRSEIEHNTELSDLLWGDFLGDRPYFGTYGKLGETKGSFALLSAMHRLKLAGLEVGLVALAHGRHEVEQNFRQRAQELGLAGGILQIPFIPHWRVPEFLRGCLAVCCLEQDFPIGIHTPIVPREVLLCGSCLVASTELIQKLPGYEQLPSGYGCVAIQNINDIGSLTERLAAIAEDPEPAAAVGARGREFARSLERDVGFPKTLEQILLTAAARQGIPPTTSVPINEVQAGIADDPFRFTRLAADALQEKDAAPGMAVFMQRTNGLVLARQVLAAIEHAVSNGETGFKPLVPAVEIEIAVATAETAPDDGRDVEDVDPLFRLRIRRWALGADDLAGLLPIRDPQMRIVEFAFDVAQYLGVRTVADFPRGPTPGPSHIVAFVHSDGAQRSPLLVDDVTARILQLSDGTRTALQIARQSTAQRRVSAIEERLEWIENLFRRGLIGLLDPDIERSQTCRAHIKRKRATVARR
jgi:hypothetical protein